MAVLGLEKQSLKQRLSLQANLLLTEEDVRVSYSSIHYTEKQTSLKVWLGTFTGNRQKCRQKLKKATELAANSRV